MWCCFLVFVLVFKIKLLYACSFVPTYNVSNKTCNYGFSGSYCDECGLRFSEPNLRIVGGQEAVANSWPSMALIVFRYKFYYSVNGANFFSETSSFCGGTLISRNTVLTASHCYMKRVEINYQSSSFPYDVKPNSFYPTYESMYTVYLGLHDSHGVFDGSNIDSGVAMSISSFTTVC